MTRGAALESDVREDVGSGAAADTQASVEIVRKGARTVQPLRTTKNEPAETEDPLSAGSFHNSFSGRPPAGCSLRLRFIGWGTQRQHILGAAHDMQIHALRGLLPVAGLERLEQDRVVL